QHPGRLRIGAAHAGRRDRDRRHRGGAAAARFQSAAAVSDHRYHRSAGHHAAHHRREALAMRLAARLLIEPNKRPFTIMLAVVVVLALIDRGEGYFLSLGTVFSVMQLFATFGLVALGLGLSMLVREFDLSVAGIVGLAGAIAVMTGVSNPWLGALLG